MPWNKLTVHGVEIRARARVRMLLPVSASFWLFL